MSFSDLVIDALTDAGNHFDVSGILETSKYASEGSQTRTRFPHQVFAPGQVSSFIKIWAQFVWLLIWGGGSATRAYAFLMREEHSLHEKEGRSLRRFGNSRNVAVPRSDEEAFLT